MEINGLPAHALLVHVVVVVLPLAAVAAVIASAWPAAQRKLTFLVPLAAVVGAAAVPITVRAGHDLDNKLGNPAFVRHHADLGSQVLPWAVALAVTTVAQWWLLRGTPSTVVRAVVGVAVVVSAIGTAVIVAATGDAGARAVWGGR
jgi:hypothetical protein